MINIITRDTLLVLAGLTATSLPEEFCSSLATPSHWRIESNSSKYLWETKRIESILRLWRKCSPLAIVWEQRGRVDPLAEESEVSGKFLCASLKKWAHRILGTHKILIGRITCVFYPQKQIRKGWTRQSKHCKFCFYIFDYSFDQSKLMVRLVRAEKMVLSGLVFARKIARMILIQNI